MGEGGQRHGPAALPRERYPVQIVQEARWAEGPKWTSTEKLSPTGIRSSERSGLTIRYTDWAILALDVDTIQYFRRILVTTGSSLLIVMSNASWLLGLTLWTFSLINPLLKKSGTLNEVWWSWWPNFTSDSAITEEVLKESCCVCRMDGRPSFSKRRSRSFCSSRAMNWVNKVHNFSLCGFCL